MLSGQSGHQHFHHMISDAWNNGHEVGIANLTIIGSDNGLAPCRRQAVIWTNHGISSTGPSGTNLSDTKKCENVVWKIAAILSRPWCVNPLDSLSMVGSLLMAMILYGCSNADKCWEITKDASVSSSYRILLHITDFDLESSSTCSYDWLSIRDGYGMSLMTSRMMTSWYGNASRIIRGIHWPPVNAMLCYFIYHCL